MPRSLVLSPLGFARSLALLLMPIVVGCGGESRSNGGDGGGASSGGSGGEPVDVCSLPAPEDRPCDTGTPWFFHDPASKQCVGRGPSDCAMGWPNVFSSLAECLATCPGARPEYRTCDFSYECELVGAACCDICDPVAESDLRAVNRNRYGAAIDCISCGACTPVAEVMTTRQYFVAECIGGRCAVRDIRTGPETACAEDSDCFLRDGSDCCEQCDGQNIVSASSREFFADRCDPTSACTTCDSPIPEDYFPECNPETGRCNIGVLPP